MLPPGVPIRAPSLAYETCSDDRGRRREVDSGAGAGAVERRSVAEVAGQNLRSKFAQRLDTRGIRALPHERAQRHPFSAIRRQISVPTNTVAPTTRTLTGESFCYGVFEVELRECS